MKNIQKIYTGLVALVVMAFASTNIMAQDFPTQQNTQNQDVVDVIQSSDEHTIFAGLLEDADMIESLRVSPQFSPPKLLQKIASGGRDDREETPTKIKNQCNPRNQRSPL